MVIRCILFFTKKTSFLLCTNVRVRKKYLGMFRDSVSHHGRGFIFWCWILFDILFAHVHRDRDYSGSVCDRVNWFIDYGMR